MKHPTILIVGLGDLGYQVLGQLMRMPFAKRLVVGGRDLVDIRKRVHLQQFTTLQHDRWEPVEIVSMDVDHLEQTAETLAAVQPDIVFNAMSLQSWRVITQLPAEVFKALDEAQFGPWLPMHLAPALALMRAVRASGIKTHVVNAAFPDAVNACLATQDLAPTVGIGNVANIIPALRLAVAHVLGRPDPRGVEVLFYAQHYLTHNIPRFASSAGIPFVLRASCDRQDVTDRIDAEEVFHHVGTTFKRQGGRPGQLLTAGSAIRVLHALATDSGALVHAPGPNGLPGGWAIRAGHAGVEVVLPRGVEHAEVLAANQACQAADGVSAIEPDGTVRFTDANMDVMERMIGYRLGSMQVTDAADAAAELARVYRAFADQYPGA